MIYPIKCYIIVICYTLSSFYNYYCIWGNKKYYGGVKSMSEKSCCFCGHRFVFQNINDKVREIITDLVENKGVTVFYTGHMGDFDELCESIVRNLKSCHRNIKIYWVIPYYMKRINANKEQYSILFDEIISPDFGDVHYKQAIKMRNQWLVDNSDIIICYVKQDGGAYKTKKYAEKTNIQIINCV